MSRFIIVFPFSFMIQLHPTSHHPFSAPSSEGISRRSTLLWRCEAPSTRWEIRYPHLWGWDSNHQSIWGVYCFTNIYMCIYIYTYIHTLWYWSRRGERRWCFSAEDTPWLFLSVKQLCHMTPRVSLTVPTPLPAKYPVPEPGIDFLWCFVFGSDFTWNIFFHILPCSVQCLGSCQDLPTMGHST